MMISKSEWQAVHDALTAEEQARIGDPPTVEQLLALDRGELCEAEAERVRDALIAYPDLARAFATEFADETKDDVVVDRPEAFAGRAAGNRGQLIFWRSFGAIAATLVLVMSAMLWQTGSLLRRPRIVTDEHTLIPDGQRGPAADDAPVITPRGDSYLLVVTLIGAPTYDRYRLDIVSSKAQKTIWSSTPLQRSTSDSFDVEVPSKFLAPGRYQVIVYGMRGELAEKVATYTIDVR